MFITIQIKLLIQALQDKKRKKKSNEVNRNSCRARNVTSEKANTTVFLFMKTLKNIFSIKWNFQN